MNKTKYLILLGLGMIVITIFAGGTVWLVNFLKVQQAADNQQILSKVLLNNPQLSSRSNLASTAAGTDSALGIRSPGVYSPLGQDYNYSHSTSTYTPGPALASCPAYAYGGSETQTTNTYQYFGGESENYRYASKYVVTDAGGSLVDYSLTVGGEQISYRGGNFAAKNTQMYYLDSGQGVALPTSTNTTSAQDVSNSVEISSEPTSTDISNYFGPDVKIEGNVVVDGKTYLAISWSYDSYCSQSTSINYLVSSRIALPADNTASVKIYQRELIDPDTYEIKLTKTYKDGISDTNLISTTETTIDKQNVNYTDVQNNFVFDYGVEIRTIDYTKYSSQEAQIANMQKYLTAHLSSFITLDSADYTIGYAYTPQADLNVDVNYYLDRNYYAANAKGEALYEEALKATQPDENTLIQHLNISYNSNSDNAYSYLSLSVYDSSATVDELKSTFGYTDDSTTQQNVQLTIDGNKVTAIAYTSEANTGSGSTGKDTTVVAPSTPGSSSSCSEADSCYQSTTIMFVYQGSTYVISASGLQNIATSIGNLKFTSINVNDDASLNAFLDKVKAASSSVSPIKAL